MVTMPKTPQAALGSLIQPVHLDVTERVEESRGVVETWVVGGGVGRWRELGRGGQRWRSVGKGGEREVVTCDRPPSLLLVKAQTRSPVVGNCR